MALAVLLTAEQFKLGLERRRLPAAQVPAAESAVELLRQAEALAQRMQLQASEQAQRVLQQVRAEGERAMQQQAAQMIDTLALNSVRVLRQLEQVLVEVVVETVQRLVAQADRAALLTAAVREVVAQSAELSFATMKVAPADLARATEEVRLLTRAQGLPQSIAVRADPQLVPGECVLTSEAGKLRIRLDLQLAVLRTALASVMQLDDAHAQALLGAAAGASSSPRTPIDAALAAALSAAPAVAGPSVQARPAAASPPGGRDG